MPSPMGLPPEPFSYDAWNALLAEIVTPEGRVDYPRLAERRDLLGRFVGELCAATERFLASEWNLRIDHAARRIFISRIFKMYAADFAGSGGSSQDYRQGVLRFVAEHRGISLATIADYEVVYNVYDWGLNDAHREPHLGPILFHEPVEHYHAGDAELRELPLYEGNFCNRTCSWCTIDGSPDGWYQRYSPAVLDQVLATL